MMKKVLKKSTALLLVLLLIIGVTPMTAFAADAELQQDADAAYYVSMPATGTDTLDLSEKSSGFVLHVYDDGGASSNYSCDCDGYLRIVAPEDCVLRFSGTGSAENSYDYLRLFDGDADTVIGSNKYDGSFTVSEHFTTGNVLRVYFFSDYSDTRGGFDLTVTVVNISSMATLSFDAGEGSGAMDLIRVVPGEQVTVPACGFTVPEDKLFSCYSDGENTYYPNDVITLNENKTLTAVYADKAVVTYAFGENTHTADFALGSRITLPAFSTLFTLPERTRFTGWQCGETLYAAGDEFTVSDSVTFTAALEDEPVILHGEEGTSYSNYENYALLPKNMAVTADLTGESEGYELWIFDNGGVNGYYAYNCDGSITVLAPEGCIMQIGADLSSESNSDYLYIYDGDSTSSDLLARYSGSPNIGRLYSTGSAVTIRFTSDSRSNYRGVDMRIIVTRPETLVTISFDPGEGSGTMDDIVLLPGDRIYLPYCSFTLPEKTYFDYYTDGTKTYRQNTAVTVTEDMRLTAVYIEKILITYQSGSDISVVEYRKGNSGNLSSYGNRFSKLPYRKAFTAWRNENDQQEYEAGTWFTANTDTVYTAVFEDLPYLIDDGSGGYYALMPDVEDVTLDLSDKANGFTFKLYDNGGASGYYANSCDGSMTITAPENYVLSFSGSICSEVGRDYLVIYDSDLTTPIGEEQFAGDVTTEIPKVYSTGNTVKVYFHTDSSCTSKGFDLTVTVLDPDTLITVTFDAGEGSGTMEPLTQLAGVPFKLPDYGFTAPEGKIFSGYSDGTDVYWPVTVTFNESKTLTALWEEATGFTYSCNGEDKAIRYAKGSIVMLPDLTDIFTLPTGTHFVGWTEKFSGDLYHAGDPYVANGPTVFTAVLEILASDGSGGWYATMPVNNVNDGLTLDLSEKASGFSFTLYDDGGADGNYADYNDGQITVKAPENMIVTVSGSGQTESGWDYLYFYDGATSRSTIINSKSYTGSFSISADDPLETTGNYLTIYFHSDSSKNYSGFALTITIIAQNQVTYVFDGDTESVAVQKDTTINLAYFDDLFASETKEFLYWQLDDDTFDEGDEYYVGDDVTFTAVTRLMPTVTFDGSGAAVIGLEPETVSPPIPFPTGTTSTLPHANVIFNIPENKYFGGWSYNGRVYNAGEEFTLTENVTFTAIWRDATAWDLLGETLNAASGTDLGAITLTQDVTAVIGSLPLTVPDGVTATIDLNGYTLDGTQAALLDGNIITVNGSLTLIDSSDDGSGVITGGGIVAYESGAFTPSDAVSAQFAATVTQSYVVEDSATDVQTNGVYSVTYCPTLADAMTAAAVYHDYKESITALPADPDSYYFWYNDSKVALLKDTTIAQDQTLEVNSDDSIWFDLNGHTFDVQGAFTGGTWGWRYVNGEYEKIFYPTSIQIVSETTPGVFRSSGTLDVNIQPWTQDTYYITGGTVNGFIGADGGVFHISGGHFTDMVMFNNGNEEAELEIELSGDARFERLEHMIYADSDASRIHMTISDNVRIKAMLFEIMGDGVLDYPVLTVSGGYFSVDPRTWLAEADGDENVVQITYVPEQYEDQTDWAADSDTYTWRVKSASSSYIIGDADNDGSITILDATVIQRYLVGFTVNSFNYDAACVTGDELTILDATAIQRFLAGFTDTHHIGETAV